MSVYRDTVFLETPGSPSTVLMLRPPTEDEAGAIAALLSTHAPEPVTEERVRRSWGAPGVDIERDARVAVADGVIVGFAAVKVEDVHTWIELHGRGPARADRLGDRRSRADGSMQAAGRPTRRCARRSSRRASSSLATRTGWRSTSTTQLPEPRWPDGVSVRSFREGEGPAVHEAHMETFEDSWEHTHEPYDEWVHWTLERPGFDPDLWLLATAEDEIAGIALCRVHETDPADRLGHHPRRAPALATPGSRAGAPVRVLRRAPAHGLRARHARRRRVESHRCATLYENAGMQVISTFDIYELPS